MEKQYYIQNKDAGYLGNAIIFWAKERKGYTANIRNAHRFTEDEAKEICQNNQNKNKAWDCDYIDNNEGNQLVTHADYLDKKKIVIF